VLFGFSEMVNQRWEEPITKTKPFCISKQVVWEAYRRVKANQGAAGVDGQSIKDFEVHLKDNQYKIWNRMSSGSYFPPPVRTVDIPKKRELLPQFYEIKNQSQIPVYIYLIQRL